MPPRDSIAPPGSLYIPSLDGIRAISFFLVFFAHAGLGGIVPGGFGVSVFFLLSGFLITTLLRTEFARYQHVSLRDFYLRRVLRILPPLYVSLALAMVLSSIGTGAPGIPFAGTLAQALQVVEHVVQHAVGLAARGRPVLRIEVGPFRAKAGDRSGLRAQAELHPRKVADSSLTMS